jgi:PmbA protein
VNALMKQLKSRVDQGEGYHATTQTVPVFFHSGKLHSIQTSQIEGMALRVIRNGRLGYATTTNVTDRSALIDAALASCAFGEAVDLEFPASREPSSVPVHDPAIAALSEERMIELGEDLIDRVGNAGDADVGVAITKVTDTIEIANTTGRRVEESRTALSVSVEVTKAKEGDIFIVSDRMEVRHLEDLDLTPLVERICRHLAHTDHVVPAPNRSVPVVFTPNGTVALLLPLAVGFNGKAVYMGASPLKGRIGEQTFDERFSLTDDGTLPHGPRSGGFDDEGTPTKRTPLVESGTVRGFLYDLRTARLAATAATGNGYKGGLMGGGGFRSAPAIGMGNVIVGTGEGSEADLIGGIDEGLLVESVLGIGQGNISAGEFSNNVDVAFKIEGGRVVGRVKNTMISGNAHRLLKDGLIGIGKTPQWVGGLLHTPPMAVRGISVVGQK